MGSNIDKLNNWSEQLLQTDKNNNLINYKSTKSNFIEILAPGMESIFDKVGSNVNLEVFNPHEKLKTDNDINNNHLSREEYKSKYSSYIKDAHHILIYNEKNDGISALKGLKKKVKGAMDETGVNIAYLTFGLIKWHEKGNRDNYLAPLLLSPISIDNNSSKTIFKINLSDDDMVLNPTFALKLKHEYGIILPVYNNEDVVEYIEKINGILNQLDWVVEPHCSLGCFSFLKINMYSDIIDNANVILQNNNVKTLMGINNENPINFVSNDVNDISTNELCNVIDADSSQETAIKMAKDGCSFVLQGPPGTGKSQTITNIIAECLNDGKKVLFVSEKLAALNVVYSKLQNENLSDFCLELHSYKANKKEFINELCNTIKLCKSEVAASAQVETEKFKNAQKLLDDYKNELHRIYPVVNKSIYQLIQEIAGCDVDINIPFSLKDIEAKGDAYYDNVINSIESYCEYVPTIGYDYKKNVWYGYQNDVLSYENELECKRNFQDFTHFCIDLLEINDLLKKSFGIDNKTINDYLLVIDLLNILINDNYLNNKCLNIEKFDDNYKIILKMNKLRIQMEELSIEIGKNYKKEILTELNAEKVIKVLNHCDTLSKRIFYKEYSQTIKRINNYLLPKTNQKYNDICEVMGYLNSYQKCFCEFKQLENKVSYIFNNNYKGIDSTWDLIVNDFVKLNEIVKNVRIQEIFNYDDNEYKEKTNEFKLYYQQLSALFIKYQQAYYYVLDSFDKFKYDIKNNLLDDVLAKINGCYTDFSSLTNWINFYKIILKLRNLGALELIDLLIERKIDSDCYVAYFKKIYCMQWAKAILCKSSILNAMPRDKHDNIRKVFVEKDKLQFEINRAKVREKLSKNRPNLSMVAQGSQVSLLLREGEKKRRQKTIRNIMMEMGDVVQLIKPCFLMSPLSVSTFLPVNISFDVVIFDEASQVFPQDALGAIYRGKQLIVVGDSKQLPPTNFFNPSYSGEYDDEDLEESVSDYNSILDLCSASFPQVRLKWHYRSQCEELITFSNVNFYNNELITFPSPIAKLEGVGIDYYYVKGIFDHKTKSNLIEAEYVVDVIFDAIKKHPDKSLGVVAFSISQQNLIEKCLEKRLSNNKDMQGLLYKKGQEEFFIKNLESVQGDERDIIIFSIGYGPDKEGKIIHNFGPINRNGGEKRLNVAITRAKLNVKVVTSMHSSDIDLKRSTAIGSSLLKGYLDYAENGLTAVSKKNEISQGGTVTFNLEKDIKDFLNKNGYEVDTKVGNSSFKIDLAVRDSKTGNYILAIGCDGESYRAIENTRDRERLRNDVLEKMGWNVYQIWSIDWMRNTLVEKQKLLNHIRSIDSHTLDNPLISNMDQYTMETCFEEELENQSASFPEYIECDLKDIVKKYLQNSYSNNIYDNFQLMVLDILNVEAPISETRLLQKICSPIFHRDSVTPYVKNKYILYMQGCKNNGIVMDKGFLYISNRNRYVLRKNSSITHRKLEEISPYELGAGMIYLLKQSISVKKVDLYKTIINEFGYNKLTDSISKYLDQALFLYRQYVTFDNDIISIK